MTARDADHGDDERLMTARAKSNHRDHHHHGHHSSKRAKTPRMRAGADQRKFSQIIGVKLPAAIDDKLTEVYRQITSTAPLPPDFEYTHMFESYVWRAIFLTSFTLGIRLGNIDLISGIFLGILGSIIVIIITYILIPAGLLYVDKKIQKKDLSIHERRIMLIVASMLLGVLASAVNQHFVIKEGTAPSYFLPGLVGLTVQVVGPKFGQNRIAFLTVTVGSALAVGVAIMAIAHDLAVGTFLALLISAFFATINLQIMVANIIAHKIDMMSSHVVAVLMALYQHLIFSRLLGEYKEDDKSTPSITNPILYS